jgi:hypothetical protein
MREHDKSRRLLTSTLVIAIAGLSPTAAAAPVSLDLPSGYHLLDLRLHPTVGAGGDGEALLNQVLNPVIGESLMGFVAAAVTVPLTLLAGQKLGTLSPDFVVAALPPLVMLLIIPPIAVTYSEWGVGRALGADIRAQPAIYVGIGIQALMFLAAFFLPISTHNLTDAAVFSLVDAIVLPAAVTGVMNLQLALQPKPAPAPPPGGGTPPTTPVARSAGADKAPGVAVFAKAF